MRAIRDFFRRLFGQRCCTEFTQWEDHKADFERIPADWNERILSGWADTITYTKRWQERRCTICGKVQQRTLNW